MAVVRRLALAILAAVFFAVPLSAQVGTGTITGRVVDSTTQQPLSDVNVVVEGTRRGAVTGLDGTYTIGGVAAGTHIIRARRIGFSAPTQSVNVPTDGTATATFALNRQAIALQDVITVGYGTQRREAITGSVASIDASTARQGIQPNVTNMIEGRAAGVTVIQNSGEPGAGAQVRIRGGTSISASNDPLYVIDGIPINNDPAEAAGFNVGTRNDGGNQLARNPLNLLNPSDIASISILKDAAATAIYGSRGANGVILIETKKGIASGTSVEYEMQTGVSSTNRHLPVLSGDQYRQFIADMIASGDTSFKPSRLTSLGTANTNWEQELTRSAPTNNHNLSFAGGSAETRYRASLNYMNQEGVVINNGFQRLQGRINGTHEALAGRLRLQVNLTGSHVNNDYIPFENRGGFEGGVFMNALQFNPTKPVTFVDPISGETKFYELGSGSQSIRNPVAMARQIVDKGNTTRVLGNFSTDFDIFSSLTARVNAGVDRAQGDRATYLPIANPLGAATNGWARQVNHDNNSKTLQTLLTLHPEFSGNSAFDLVGGYEFNEYIQSEFGAQSQGFLSDAFGYDNLQGATSRTDSSWREQSRLVSFFGRANYNFKEKYFLTGVWRRDGSSRFGIGNKWAVFPAISGSWRIAEESFFPHTILSDLRLRAGWGKQGNQAISPYASLVTLGSNGDARYVFGNAAVVGVAPVRNANPNLKWEETAATNVALDYGFLGNRVLGTIEYYVKNTKDLLLTVSVPQPAVASDRLENVGRLRNTGLEMSLDGQLMSRPQFTWTGGFVFAHEKNTVQNLGPYAFITTGDVSGQGQSGQRAQRIIPGQPLGTFYGPEFVGVNAKGQQLFNHYTVTSTTDANGVVHTTKTLNGTTTAPGADDNVVLGNANPTYTLGLRSQANWKAFDISAQINNVHGQKVFNNTALVYGTKANALNDKNFLLSALNDGIGVHEPSIYSSKYIEDGSFVRLQNVTVGWTFDMPRFTGMGRTARLSLSGDNLWLHTSYSGYDPEVYTEALIGSRGVDYLHYPRPRTFTGGLRVTF
jgi:TonB-dependent starch-binding outer membrane protein SusC